MRNSCSKREGKFDFKNSSARASLSLYFSMYFSLYISSLYKGVRDFEGGIRDFEVGIRYFEGVCRYFEGGFEISKGSFSLNNRTGFPSKTSLSMVINPFSSKPFIISPQRFLLSCANFAKWAFPAQQPRPFLFRLSISAKKHLSVQFRSANHMFSGIQTPLKSLFKSVGFKFYSSKILSPS